MHIRTRRASGFTLIELLVVVLILGILLAIAIPAYLSSIKGSRASTAMANARMIATAVQTKYVKAGGSSYSGFDAATLTADATGFLADVGGSVPKNPCTGGTSLSTDYDVVAGSTSWTITPKDPSGNCDTLTTVKIGS